MTIEDCPGCGGEIKINFGAKCILHQNMVNCCFLECGKCGYGHISFKGKNDLLNRHRQSSDRASELAAYRATKEATGGMDILCNSCGALVAKITGDNPDFDGTCLKCRASIHIRSYEAQSWRFEQLEHFAKLAKPIVIDAKALFGGLTEDDEGVEECERCLAAYPEKDSKPRKAKK